MKKLKKLTRCILATVFAVSILSSSIDAAKAALKVAPVIVNVVSKGRSTLVLVSTSKQDTTYSIRAYLWTQINGADELTRATDFVITPPIVTLRPGERREIRIGTAKPNKGPTEKTYRIEITELPKDDSQGGQLGVATRVRMLLPVFVAPANREAKADTRWTVKKVGEGYVIRGENTGDITEQFVGLGVSTKDNDNAPETIVANLNRILPKSWREWSFKSNAPIQKIFVRKNNKRKFEAISFDLVN